MILRTARNLLVLVLVSQQLAGQDDPFGELEIPDRDQFPNDNNLSFRAAFSRFGFLEHDEARLQHGYVGEFIIIRADAFGPIIGLNLKIRDRLVAVERIQMNGRTSDVWGAVETRERRVLDKTDQIDGLIETVLADGAFWSPLTDLEKALVESLTDDAIWYFEVRTKNVVKSIRLLNVEVMTDWAPMGARDYAPYLELYNTLDSLAFFSEEN